MWDGVDDALVMLIPIVSTISSFLFLAILVWLSQRRKEREAYYRYELGRKIVEKGGVSEERLLEVLGSDAAGRWRRRREGLKLSGLITLSLGIGLMAALQFVDDVAVWQVGWIPTAIGAAMLLYGLVLAPKDPAKG